jgi:hypothetical protein
MALQMLLLAALAMAAGESNLSETLEDTISTPSSHDELLDSAIFGK